MTGKEVIKDLECCASGKNCEECSLNCKAPTSKDILDLINRQQAEIEKLTTLSELGKMRANDYRVMRNRALKAEAEIERLNNNISAMATTMSNSAKGTRAEAIKEFWSRLQGIAYQSEREWSHGEHPMVVELDDAEEIYEEMVGEDK